MAEMCTLASISVACLTILAVRLAHSLIMQNRELVGLLKERETNRLFGDR